MSSNLERRNAKRTIFTMNIEFLLIEKNSVELVERAIRGVTFNVSQNGLCIYTTMPIRKGQQLKILKSDLPFHDRKVSVQWVRKINDELFKTGLMFVNEETPDLHGVSQA